MFQLENNQVSLYDSKIEVKQDPEDDDERAIDLDFVLEGSNDLLTRLHGSLKTALYRKPDASEEQQMDMINDPNLLPVLKFPDMKPFKWGYKGEGYQLDILSDLDQSPILEFDDVSVKNIEVSPKEGGTVKIKFRCRVHPTEKQVGRIYSITKQTFPINLSPPEVDSDMLDNDAPVSTVGDNDDLPASYDEDLPPDDENAEMYEREQEELRSVEEEYD